MTRRGGAARGGDATDPYHPQAVKASAGAVFGVLLYEVRRQHVG